MHIPCSTHGWYKCHSSKLDGSDWHSVKCPLHHKYSIGVLLVLYSVNSNTLGTAMGNKILYYSKFKFMFIHLQHPFLNCDIILLLSYVGFWFHYLKKMPEQLREVWLESVCVYEKIASVNVKRTIVCSCTIFM